jgi:histidinol-phosphatase
MAVPSDLALAHHLADLSAAIAGRHFARSTLAVHTKSDGSPVTEADREIEETLRARIRGRCPTDAFLGEESGACRGVRRRWIIDGVDGTASFVAGEPEWSTLIALEEDGVITLGMVSAPALDRRWWAAPGAGAWEGPCGSRAVEPPRRLSLACGGDIHDLHDAVLGIWPPPDRLSVEHRAVVRKLAGHVGRTVPALDWYEDRPAAPSVRKPSAGSGTCHGGLLVATGQMDAFVLLGAGPWDIAALVPVVEEAGGVCTDLAGRRRIDTGTALFARAGLHRQLLDIASR